MFVYSVAEASSLHFLAQWIKDTQNFAPNAIRILVGNKKDLESEMDETTAQSFSNAHGFTLQAQTSCKTNEGIADAFEKLARALHKPDSILADPKKPADQAQHGMTLSDSNDNSNIGGCNC